MIDCHCGQYHCPIHPDNEILADDWQEYRDWLDSQELTFDPVRMLPDRFSTLARIARTMKAVAINFFDEICECRILGTEEIVMVPLTELRCY